MVVTRLGKFWLAVVCLCGSSAFAQSNAPNTELTFFGGLRTGGEISTEDSDAVYKAKDTESFGVIWNKRQKTNTQWEVYFSQQQTEVELRDSVLISPKVDVDIYTLQLGGTYLFNSNSVQPYLAMTLGGTHVKANADGGSSDTFVSGSLGLGFKFGSSERLGFRLEARAHGVLVQDNSQLFCRTGPVQNVCVVQIEGDMFGQFETFAGITFRF